MIDIEEIFYQQIKQVISGWDEEDIYAVSFFVCSNEMYDYGGYSNVTEFAISYNTEADCEGAGELDEERWNYAFWRQNEIPIVDVQNGNEGVRQLFAWYKENGVENVGEEDPHPYDEKMRYVGKGPVGEYELVTIAEHIAARFQEEGIMRRKFGKPVPIIVHGLEYTWYNMEATQRANPNGEADVFVRAMKAMGWA